MARMARVVVAFYPHHVTQRGNRRRQIFLAMVITQPEKGVVALKQSLNRSDDYSARAPGLVGPLWTEFKGYDPFFRRAARGAG